MTIHDRSAAFVAGFVSEICKLGGRAELADTCGRDGMSRGSCERWCGGDLSDLEEWTLRYPDARGTAAVLVHADGVRRVVAVPTEQESRRRAAAWAACYDGDY